MGNYLIQLRHDLEENWAAANPVLRAAEVGVIDSPNPDDVRRYKVGDGVTPWNSLQTYESIKKGGNNFIVLVSQSEYDEMVAHGLIDPNKIYMVYEDEQ